MYSPFAKSLLIVAILAGIVFGPGHPDFCCAVEDAATSTPDDDPVGVIIPAYFDPGKLWKQIIADKKAHPGVPFYLIANPNSGPGSERDDDYVRGIRDAQAAGIVVVGYVDTNYSKRPASKVEADISRWELWYKIDGIFLDEMSSDAGSEAYYATLTRSVNANHLITIGNPGTTVAKTYYGTVNILMIHEDRGYADGAATGLPASELASITTQCPVLDFARIRAQHVGLVYPTDEKDPPTYARLPRYFDQLVRQLDDASGK